MQAKRQACVRPLRCGACSPGWTVRRGGAIRASGQWNGEALVARLMDFQLSPFMVSEVVSGGDHYGNP